MVDEVMDSANAPAVVAEPVVATPDVPADQAVEPIAPQPTAAVASKPVKVRKPKAEMPKAAAEKMVEAAVEAVVKPAKAIKKIITPAKSKTGPRAAKLPAKAASVPVPAVKPASKRPFTAIPGVKAPSVKTSAGSTAAPATAKELFAMVTTPTEFTEKMQSAFKDAQEKAKAALGDAGSFTKGNVEAMVESSKILAAGLQDMTKGYVAETKTSFETMTADVKGFAAVKSPTEFFELQSAMMRKNFDAAVAASSKNSEAMLKLVTEAFQPISTRVSLAVEKIKQAA